jgi:hypothetical protein
MLETPRKRSASKHCARNVGAKGGYVWLFGLAGRSQERPVFIYFCSGPPNIFIIAACINAWRLGYFV